LQQPADLDQVVGEHAVAAPEPGAVDAVHAGVVPAEAELREFAERFGVLLWVLTDYRYGVAHYHRLRVVSPQCEFATDWR
jgi:hypothetical protein